MLRPDAFLYRIIVNLPYREILANNIHSNKGMYFMDIDCGLDMKKEHFSEIYQEEGRQDISWQFHA